MTNLKLSSKMHIMVALTAAIIAIGFAMGMIFQFVANGYFNYGQENSSYQTVVVDYAVVEFDDRDELIKLCDEEFDKAGVKYYSSNYGSIDMGGELTFTFANSVDGAKIQSASDAIHERLNASATASSNASYHVVNTQHGTWKTVTYGAIAVAAAIAFQFIYFAVRYRLTMAFAALLANVHNLAIFISLLAITRVPIGSSVAVFGVLTVLMTMIGCCLFFDKVRKNLKDEKFASLGIYEQVDTCVGASLVNTVTSSVAVAAIAVLLFVLLAISALSVQMIVSPVVLALICAVANVYGTAFFIPPVYARFKRIGDDFKAKHTNKK